MEDIDPGEASAESLQNDIAKEVVNRAFQVSSLMVLDKLADGTPTGGSIDSASEVLAGSGEFSDSSAFFDNSLSTERAHGLGSGTRNVSTGSILHPSDAPRPDATIGLRTVERFAISKSILGDIDRASSETTPRSISPSWLAGQVEDPVVDHPVGAISETDAIDPKRHNRTMRSRSSSPTLRTKVSELRSPRRRSRSTVSDVSERSYYTESSDEEKKRPVEENWGAEADMERYKYQRAKPTEADHKRYAEKKKQDKEHTASVLNYKLLTGQLKFAKEEKNADEKSRPDIGKGAAPAHRSCSSTPTTRRTEDVAPRDKTSPNDSPIVRPSRPPSRVEDETKEVRQEPPTAASGTEASISTPVVRQYAHPVILGEQEAADFKFATRLQIEEASYADHGLQHVQRIMGEYDEASKSRESVSTDQRSAAPPIVPPLEHLNMAEVSAMDESTRDQVFATIASRLEQLPDVAPQERGGSTPTRGPNLRSSSPTSQGTADDSVVFERKGFEQKGAGNSSITGDDHDESTLPTDAGEQPGEEEFDSISHSGDPREEDDPLYFRRGTSESLRQQLWETAATESKIQYNRLNFIYGPSHWVAEDTVIKIPYIGRVRKIRVISSCGVEDLVESHSKVIDPSCVCFKINTTQSVQGWAHLDENILPRLDLSSEQRRFTRKRQERNICERCGKAGCPNSSWWCVEMFITDPKKFCKHCFCKTHMGEQCSIVDWEFIDGDPSTQQELRKRYSLERAVMASLLHWTDSSLKIEDRFFCIHSLIDPNSEEWWREYPFGKGYLMPPQRAYERIVPIWWGKRNANSAQRAFVDLFAIWYDRIYQSDGKERYKWLEVMDVELEVEVDRSTAISGQRSTIRSFYIRLKNDWKVGARTALLGLHEKVGDTQFNVVLANMSSTNCMLSRAALEAVDMRWHAQINTHRMQIVDFEHMRASTGAEFNRIRGEQLFANMMLQWYARNGFNWLSLTRLILDFDEIFESFRVEAVKLHFTLNPLLDYLTNTRWENGARVKIDPQNSKYQNLFMVLGADSHKLDDMRFRWKNAPDIHGQIATGATYIRSSSTHFAASPMDSGTDEETDGKAALDWKYHFERVYSTPDGGKTQGSQIFGVWLEAKDHRSSFFRENHARIAGRFIYDFQMAGGGHIIESGLIHGRTMQILRGAARYSQRAWRVHESELNFLSYVILAEAVARSDPIMGSIVSLSKSWSEYKRAVAMDLDAGGPHAMLSREFTLPRGRYCREMRFWTNLMDQLSVYMFVKARMSTAKQSPNWGDPIHGPEWTRLTGGGMWSELSDNTTDLESVLETSSTMSRLTELYADVARAVPPSTAGNSAIPPSMMAADAKRSSSQFRRDIDPSVMGHAQLSPIVSRYSGPPSLPIIDERKISTVENKFAAVQEWDEMVHLMIDGAESDMQTARAQGPNFGKAEPSLHRIGETDIVPSDNVNLGWKMDLLKKSVADASLMNELKFVDSFPTGDETKASTMLEVPFLNLKAVTAQQVQRILRPDQGIPQTAASDIGSSTTGFTDATSDTLSTPSLAIPGPSAKSPELKMKQEMKVTAEGLWKAPSKVPNVGASLKSMESSTASTESTTKGDTAIPPLPLADAQKVTYPAQNHAKLSQLAITGGMLTSELPPWTRDAFNQGILIHKFIVEYQKAEATAELTLEERKAKIFKQRSAEELRLVWFYADALDYGYTVDQVKTAIDIFLDAELDELHGSLIIRSRVHEIILEADSFQKGEIEVGERSTILGVEFRPPVQRRIRPVSYMQGDEGSPGFPPLSQSSRSIDPKAAAPEPLQLSTPTDAPHTKKEKDEPVAKKVDKSDSEAKAAKEAPAREPDASRPVADDADDAAIWSVLVDATLLQGLTECDQTKRAIAQEVLWAEDLERKLRYEETRSFEGHPLVAEPETIDPSLVTVAGSPMTYRTAEVATKIQGELEDHGYVVNDATKAAIAAATLLRTEAYRFEIIDEPLPSYLDDPHMWGYRRLFHQISFMINHKFKQLRTRPEKDRICRWKFQILKKHFVLISTVGTVTALSYVPEEERSIIDWDCDVMKNVSIVDLKRAYERILEYIEMLAMSLRNGASWRGTLDPSFFDTFLRSQGVALIKPRPRGSWNPPPQEAGKWDTSKTGQWSTLARESERSSFGSGDWGKPEPSWTSSSWKQGDWTTPAEAKDADVPSTKPTKKVVPTPSSPPPPPSSYPQTRAPDTESGKGPESSDELKVPFDEWMLIDEVMARRQRLVELETVIKQKYFQEGTPLAQTGFAEEVEQEFARSANLQAHSILGTELAELPPDVKIDLAGSEWWAFDPKKLTKTYRSTIKALDSMAELFLLPPLGPDPVQQYRPESALQFRPELPQADRRGRPNSGMVGTTLTEFARLTASKSPSMVSFGVDGQLDYDRFENFWRLSGPLLDVDGNLLDPEKKARESSLHSTPLSTASPAQQQGGKAPTRQSLDVGPGVPRPSDHLARPASASTWSRSDTGWMTEGGRNSQARDAAQRLDDLGPAQLPLWGRLASERSDRPPLAVEGEIRAAAYRPLASDGVSRFGTNVFDVVNVSKVRAISATVIQKTSKDYTMERVVAERRDDYEREVRSLVYQFGGLPPGTSIAYPDALLVYSPDDLHTRLESSHGQVVLRKANMWDPNPNNRGIMPTKSDTHPYGFAASNFTMAGSTYMWSYAVFIDPTRLGASGIDPSTLPRAKIVNQEEAFPLPTMCPGIDVEPWVPPHIHHLARRWNLAIDKDIWRVNKGKVPESVQRIRAESELEFDRLAPLIYQNRHDLSAQNALRIELDLFVRRQLLRIWPNVNTIAGTWDMHGIAAVIYVPLDLPGGVDAEGNIFQALEDESQFHRSAFHQSHLSISQHVWQQEVTWEKDRDALMDLWHEYIKQRHSGARLKPVPEGTSVEVRKSTPDVPVIAIFTYAGEPVTHLLAIRYTETYPTEFAMPSREWMRHGTPETHASVRELGPSGFTRKVVRTWATFDGDLNTNAGWLKTRPCTCGQCQGVDRLLAIYVHAIFVCPRVLFGLILPTSTPTSGQSFWDLGQQQIAGNVTISLNRLAIPLHLSTMRGFHPGTYDEVERGRRTAFDEQARARRPVGWSFDS